jgi:hypothetical protein
MSAMSNQLAIQAGLPVHGSGDSTAPPRSTTPIHTPEATKPVALFVNPSYRFDPTVGLVVIEFHNSQGTLSNSIPSQRQLQAYRTHLETPPGEQAPAAPQPVDGKTSSG